MFSHLKLSPPTHHQWSWIHVGRLTYNACYEPSVTDASNPKKQLSQKWSATAHASWYIHILEANKMQYFPTLFLIWYTTLHVTSQTHYQSTSPVWQIQIAVNTVSRLLMTDSISARNMQSCIIIISRNLSNDRSKASSKTITPHRAI